MQQGVVTSVDSLFPMECCIRSSRVFGWYQLQALCCILVLVVSRFPVSNAQVIGGGGLPLIGNWPLVANVAPGQLNLIVDALRTAGFSLAGLTINALKNFLPAYTTLMIPTNEAIAQFVNLNQTQLPSVLLYHAVSQVLPFQILSQYPVGQMLPTMLFGRQLVVTNNSASNFMVDNAKVVKPNMCGGSGVVTCHGIDRVLLPSFAAGVSPALAPFVPPVLVPAAAPAAARVSPPSPTQALSPPQIVIPGSAIAPGAGPVAVSVGPTGPPGSGASLSNASFMFSAAIVCLLSSYALMFMQ